MSEDAQLKAAEEQKMTERETLEEKLPGLFEPDTLLPIQYFEAMRRKHVLEGEKRLVLSVLEDAVECFMKCISSPTGKGQRLFREAEEWIELEDKRWVFSFDNVCEMLDINPEYMRRGLRRWKERKLEDLARAPQQSTDEPAPPNNEAAAEPAKAEAQTVANKSVAPARKSGANNLRKHRRPTASGRTVAAPLAKARA